MKFRFLLWMLGRLMAKASRDNPAFRQQLEGRDLVFQLHTLDGKVARHFIVANQRITSRRGTVSEPAVAAPSASRPSPSASRMVPTVMPR